MDKRIQHLKVLIKMQEERVEGEKKLLELYQKELKELKRKGRRE